MGEGSHRARDAARATRQPSRDVGVNESLMINTTVPLDVECETCQGNGIITTPEWLEWDKAERQAEARWKAANPGESWLRSDTQMHWTEQQPDEAEMQCGDCGGTGRKLTDAGRTLLQFLRTHGRS
jgi:hypothetical protein